MKILMIGNISGKGDEGLTQISKKFLNLLSQEHEVQFLNTREVISVRSFIRVFKFKPEILHYITGITFRSLVLSKVLKILLFNKPKTIISAIRVFLTPLNINFLKYVKPDLILVQANKWNNVFNKANIKTKYLPNPVNNDKYYHRLEIDKDQLKKKYSLPKDSKILLHVGHIRQNRGLELFIRNKALIEEMDFKVLIVGSTFHNTDFDLLKELKESGFYVLNEFLPSIEEIYLLSDIYVFSVLGLEENYFPKKYLEVGVIDQPLSIIEALCCGLPVVSTEVDSISNLLSEDLNLPVYFFDESGDASFRDAILKAEKYSYTPNNLPNLVSENVIGEEINRIYRSLLS